jgi:ketosteroid isomerase-like protein
MSASDVTTDPVAQLLDREAIKELTHRYGRALDTFDLEGIVEIWVPDGVFDVTPFGLDLLEGHEALRTFFRHNQEVMANQIHLFANHIIEFDGPDEAHGTNYLFQDGYTNDGARIHCLGLNEDRYTRTAEGWRITTRTIRPLVTPKLEGY